MRRVCSSLLAVCSSPILPRSLAPCSTEWEGHQGCIIVVTLVFITIHTQPPRSYTGVESGYHPPSPSSAPALFTHNFLSMTKSLPGWGDSPSSPSLQKKYGGHFVWCWLKELRAQLCLYDCPYIRKKPLRVLLKGSSSWEPDLHFFRGRYSSSRWIYIKATEGMQQKTWKIKILFLIWMYEYLLHRFAQQQPWVEKSPC